VQDLSIEDRVAKTQYQFLLSSPDAAALSTWTHQLVERLRTLPQLADVGSDMQEQGLQAYIEIDRSAASRLGVTVAAIDNALYNAFGQRLISTIFTQSNQYRVVLEADPAWRTSPRMLGQLYVPSTLSASTGVQIPLSSVARVIENPPVWWSTTWRSFLRPRCRSTPRRAWRWAMRWQGHQGRRAGHGLARQH
jgi:multidrug efflux pump